MSTDGNTEYWSCDRCGMYFSDVNGEHQIAENSWIIAHPAIKSYTVTLGGDISVNYYVYVNSAAFPGAITATYTYGSDDYRTSHTNLTATVTTANKYGANYKITCPINARSMAEKIDLTVNCAGTELLTDSTFRVIDYADNLSGYADKWKTLMCAMLDCGGEVQKYFNYNIGDLASAYIDRISDSYSAVYPESLDDNTNLNFTTDLSAYGIEYQGATLMLKSTTSVRLYFHKTGDGDLPSVTANGASLDWKYKEVWDLHYIEISGISAQNFFGDISVAFNGGSAFTYNVACYYNSAVGGSIDANVILVVQKLYLYFTAAKTALNS